jgi:signal transduction histidine kinase
VLTNLIDNAARYTPAGAPIIVRAYAGESSVIKDWIWREQEEYGK